MWAFQVALYRRNAEERARQELQVKLDQVNLFLQVGKKEERESVRVF